MATEVSSPPEYASTTRSVTGNSLSHLVGDHAGPFGELVGQGLAAGDVAGHDENGVVAGDGADDVGEPGAVQRAGQELRRPGRGSQYRDVAAGVHTGEKLVQQPQETGRALLGVAQGPLAVLGDEVGAADLHRAELL